MSVHAGLLKKSREPQEKKRDTINQAKKNNTKSLDTAKKKLREPGTIVAISIEGTRGTEARLLAAQSGVEELLCNDCTRALPITLIGVHRMQPDREIKLSGINPLVQVEARVGELISFIQVQELARQYQWVGGIPLSVSDTLMMHLAKSGLEVIRKGVNPLGFYERVMKG